MRAATLAVIGLVTLAAGVNAADPTIKITSIVGTKVNANQSNITIKATVTGNANTNYWYRIE
jgi:hypothetical protein